MIKHNRCKCLNAPDPVCALANVQPSGDNHIMHDPKDQGESKNQCESPVPADDYITYNQFMEEGWELKGDHEGLDTEQDKGKIIELPTSFVAEEFFTKENDWPATSQSILINEHNDRTGLKGVVFRATIDNNWKSGFDCLSKE